MTEQNTSSLSPLIEQINRSILLNTYEYDPKLYGLNEIDCAELTANNVIEMFREEMEYFTKQILSEYEYKLIETNTLHIFNIICHRMWHEVDSIQKYYFEECDRTRQAILEHMECYEASTHMGDYINEPQ